MRKNNIKKNKQQSITIREPYRSEFIKKYPRMLTIFINKAIKAALEENELFIKIITKEL